MPSACEPSSLSGSEGAQRRSLMPLFTRTMLQTYARDWDRLDLCAPLLHARDVSAVPSRGSSLVLLMPSTRASWLTLSASLQVTAAAACFLASKVEEKPRSLRTILGCALEAERHNGIVAMHKGRVKADENDRHFIDFKRAVLHCEETMLRALCFDLTVRLPYPAVTNGVKRMWKGDGETGEQVARAAWVIINDT
jgi:hypothetical protein